MGSILNPYIAFRDGKARAAAEFYQSVFGGELNVSTFGEFGAAHEGLDPEWVMHGQLITPAGYTIMVSDAAGSEITVGDNISVSLSGDVGDELRGYFGSLSDGGNVTMALEKQMWGDEFGMVVDKFGIQWMVNIAGGQS
jgi:PhnB protein